MPSQFEVVVSMAEEPTLTTTESPNLPIPNPISNLETRVDQLETDVAALEAIDTAYDTRLDALEAADIALDTRLDTAEGNISDLQNNVGGHDTSISSLESSITSLDTRLDTAETDIANLEAQVGIAAISGVTLVGAGETLIIHQPNGPALQANWVQFQNGAKIVIRNTPIATGLRVSDIIDVNTNSTGVAYVNATGNFDTATYQPVEDFFQHVLGNN